ncbi:MAG: AAA family ATPase, partial [Lachnospiraceae bacterium]|nr:AAA family ATPase [Lachnospiraceae bacterium]
MGTYLNPGNRGFIEIRNRTYVDKTGLIGQINETIGTKEKLICISRPRRFGKSYATQMLCAYYDKTCDSAELFDDLAIAVDERWNGSYCQHLNQYDVIYLDMTNLMGEAGEEGIVAFIRSKVTEELTAAYPQLETDESFSTTLIRAVELTGNQFVMIIDEWDVPIRETPGIQKEYLRFLRTLFKGSGTTDRIFAAAYMTGILPIKKDGSQSAISDFQEFPVIKPRYFGPYVGFTEDEVKRLCQEYHCDFEQMKYWYDGYSFRGVGSVYNPNSVMKAIRYGDFDSYWTQTSAAESLAGYVSLDYDGLSKTVTELIGGGRVPVDTYGFSNDLVTFRNRDDVLTLLIHLGYLAYEDENGTARIPNEEIRQEFVKMIRQVKRDDTIRRVQESDQLILDTIQGKEEAVAAQIERI